MNECIFCKIIKKEIDTEFIYEDDRTIAFLDIHPNHPGHALVLPRAHSRNFLSIQEDDLAALACSIQKVAQAVMRATKADGVNIISNNEPAAGQLIFHTHAHIIPRFAGDGFKHWPHKEYKEGEMIEVASKIREYF